MNSATQFEEFFKDFSCNCKNVQKKSFKKGQTITTYIQKRNQVCILQNGEADLVRYDFNGDKSIIEHFNIIIFSIIFIKMLYSTLILHTYNKPKISINLYKKLLIFNFSFRVNIITNFKISITLIKFILPIMI